MSLRARGFVLLATLAAALGTAACTDRNPAASARAPLPDPPPGAALALSCTMEVRAERLACAPQRPETESGVSAAVIGGQGVNVRLRSSGTTYDSSTAILRSFVTVENLTSQALGLDGNGNWAYEGVRVFFQSGPTTTEGAGTVTVDNADGVEAFTAGGQPYFQYYEVLAPGDTSEAREWRFAVPASVETFVFTVLVATPVPRETGWIALSPMAPSLAVGDTQRMATQARSISGRVEGAGVAVTWTSSAPGVATVDAGGLVTAVGVGTAKITATGGDRAGSAEVRVFGSAAAVLPTLVAMELLPSATMTAGVDSVRFRLRIRSPGAGLTGLGATLRGPSGYARRSCVPFRLVSGTLQDGVYWCEMALPEGSESGFWTMDVVSMRNGAGLRTVAGAALRGAGGPQYLHVRSPNQDVTPPTFVGFGFSPDTVDVSEDLLVLDVGAADAGIGTASVEIVFRNPNDGSETTCPTAELVSGTPANGVYRCYKVLLPTYDATSLLVHQLRLHDRNGNERVVTAGELQAGGFPTVVGVRPNVVSP